MPRLDTFLVTSGKVPSRSLAAKLIRAGSVFVDGRECMKCSFPVTEENRIVVRDSELVRYVSRGGLKLEEALHHWDISPEGMVCADIGASTGGFTHCLLHHGAKKVFAVDSGSDQLHPSLREDKRVVSLENRNARFLDEGLFGKVDLVVMDVSFISQTLLYPAVCKILKEDGIFISLIKPQFEVGRENIGGGGIVKSEKARETAVEKIRLAAEKHALILSDVIPSPITGGDGNVEYLGYFKGKGK